MSTGDRYPSIGIFFQLPQTNDGGNFLSVRERVEISALLRELVDCVETLMVAAEATPNDEPGQESHADFLARARAMVEKLEPPANG